MYYAAFLVIIFHYFILLAPIITYFKTTSKRLKQLIISWLWILLGINIYYKGCPFIRLERKLLGIPSWIGIHQYLTLLTPNPPKFIMVGSTLLTFLGIMFAFWVTY